MLEQENQKIKELIGRIDENISALKIPERKEELEHLTKKQSDPELYNDFEKLKEINIQVKKIENLINPWFEVQSSAEDTEVLISMSMEEKDSSHGAEIQQTLVKMEKSIVKLELFRMFTKDTDYANTFINIHPGAGGTESCDWASMLYRMYIRYIERKGLEYEVLEYSPGEEAGLKSATLYVKGAYSHGFLKCETGVHRLVRISPFDSNKRRHTSFCSVYSSPEIDDSVEVDIKTPDLRIDTFRAAGAGGQHVNTTDSAVRITHLPTGIVVSCQAERSQHQNKERAMKVLKSKLYDHYRAEKEAEIEADAAEKKKIEWGSQIRSYVFHPYNMVKDHRTEYEVSDVQGVMDGDIDEFIYNYLKQ